MYYTTKNINYLAINWTIYVKELNIENFKTFLKKELNKGRNNLDERE